MTVDFKIEDVDVGPRGCFSGDTAFCAFRVLDVDIVGKGRDGDVVAADTLLARTDFLRVSPLAEHVLKLEALPDGADISNDDAVLLCLAWLRWLAEQTVGAGRTHVRWLP